MHEDKRLIHSGFLLLGDFLLHCSTDACVSLYVFDNEECTGTPLRTVTYPTWRKTGSKCYHDTSVTGRGTISVKDQYCDYETGHWHQTAFMSSTHCSQKWWNIDDGFDLTYTTDNCIGGYRLAECHLGPCDRSQEGNENGVEAAFESVVAVAMAAE